MIFHLWLLKKNTSGAATAAPQRLSMAACIFVLLALVCPPLKGPVAVRFHVSARLQLVAFKLIRLNGATVLKLVF